MGRDGMVLGRDGRVLGRDGRVLVHTPRLLEPSAWMLVLDAGRGLALQTSSQSLLHVAQGSCDPPPPPHRVGVVGNRGRCDGWRGRCPRPPSTSILPVPLHHAGCAEPASGSHPEMPQPQASLQVGRGHHAGRDSHTRGRGRGHHTGRDSHTRRRGRGHTGPRRPDEGVTEAHGRGALHPRGRGSTWSHWSSHRCSHLRWRPSAPCPRPRPPEGEIHLLMEGVEAAQEALLELVDGPLAIRQQHLQTRDE